MPNLVLRKAIPALFNLTSREKAMRQCEEMRDKYRELAEQVNEEQGRMPVRVPPMRGIDEDMREWSFFMILKHNLIVNRAITATVVQLARGEELSGAARIDPKKDVMPDSLADVSAVDDFLESINHHVEAVRALGPLKGTRTSPHPVFGAFDAHQWNCMFPFHLSLHLPQARHVVGEARTQTE